MHRANLSSNQDKRANSLKQTISKLLGVLALAICAQTSARAIELSHSYFGTLQYTQSTDEFAYNRFIDDEGTFRHNSLLGYQLDARLSRNVVGTLQLIATNKLDSDSGQEVRFRQGFLGYEKSDWTFRLGRQRVPLYLDSRNFDVKHTYTVTNLPPEVYLSSAADSYDGFSITRNLSSFLPESHANGYAQITFYAGPLDFKIRSARFDRTTLFFPVKADIVGTAFSASGDDWSTNASFTKLDGEVTGNRQFGPLGFRPFSSDADIDFFAAGIRKKICEHVALTVEYLHEANNSFTTISLPMGGSLVQSAGSDANSVALIGEYQFNNKLTGYLGYYDQNGESVAQNSIALGARFDLDSNRSIKAEILAVNSKEPPSVFEGPGPRSFNIFSLSYNWAY